MGKKQPEHEPLIDLSQSLRGPIRRGLYTLVKDPVESFLSVKSLNRAYEQYSTGEIERTVNFFIDALKYLRISYQITEEDLNKIPKEGPVMIVANHPLGGIDGVVLGALLTSVREDVRILANSLLWHIREIRPWLIQVNPFGGREAVKQNIKGIKQSISWIRNGGCVGTFPSGTVSHLHLRQRQIVDPPWHANTARIVRHSKATVVPLYFSGKNSAAFQLIGLVHPLLRTAMLPREFMNKCDTTLSIRVGQPIPYRKLESFKTDDALTDFLRLNTYILRNREEDKTRKRWLFPAALPKPEPKPEPEGDPLAGLIPPHMLEEEIAKLPAHNLLVNTDEYDVYIAKAEHIPYTLKEIGRLREKTFREVGEGTGRSRDLDKFDEYYRHLFMWDKKKRTIVGAYRIGMVDEILDKHGVKGLYTSTLFKFKPGAIDYFNPGLELGRSFIVSEYQRKGSSLVLIWRAIHRFVAQNPDHSILFGPVSITREYQTLSKDLMVQFLRNKNFDPELGSLIKPRNPPRRAKLKSAEKQALQESLRDIDDVSALIAEIETDKKGAPTLLRHYLKLNGQLLSFNIDPDFGECLDGLIMVDFVHGNQKLIRNYMGQELYESFARHHKIPLEQE